VYEFILFLITFAVSFVGVELFRRWSHQKGIVDYPNERSSHIDPTPRGGGLIVAIVCLAGYLILSQWRSEQIVWGYFAGAVIVVSISWLDDLYSVSSLLRFGCHLAAAALLILDAGFLHAFSIPETAISFDFHGFGMILTALWIVWLINAYNFMDGIDGIAGLQAVLAGLGWMTIAAISSTDWIIVYALIVTAASLGFLLHNWQPARIFMGDAGSAFFGFTFAALPLLAIRENPGQSAIFPAAGVVVVWFFVFDSLITLFIRLIKKQKVWTAHRQHIYQRMVISGKSHQYVTTLYGILTAIVIAAFAAAAQFGGIAAGLAVFIIFILSVALTINAARTERI